MRAQISKRLVQTLKPEEAPYEVRDTAIRGLILRVQPSGVKSYVVELGRGRRMTLGRVPIMTLAEARRQATIKLGDVANGGDPLAERRRERAHTLRTFLEEVYRPWAEQHLRCGPATIARIRACFGEYENRKLHEVNLWIVEKWRTARLKHGTRPVTINRDLAALKASLSKAVDWGLLVTHPIAKAKPLKVDPFQRERYLLDDEEQRLRAALDARETRLREARASANTWRDERGHGRLPGLAGAVFADYLKPLVLLALHTGLRRGELLGLSWPDVDLDHAQLTVCGRTAKSGRTRHVPLNAEALAIAQGWKESGGADLGPVFTRYGVRLASVKKSWAAVLDAAGIENFRFHDLRHSFASRLVSRGVDLNTVRELLGHASLAMTIRYSHLAPELKRAAVEKLIAAVA